MALGKKVKTKAKKRQESAAKVAAQRGQRREFVHTEETPFIEAANLLNNKQVLSASLLGNLTSEQRKELSGLAASKFAIRVSDQKDTEIMDRNFDLSKLTHIDVKRIHDRNYNPHIIRNNTKETYNLG